jgi:hypothetical protein
MLMLAGMFAVGDWRWDLSQGRRMSNVNNLKDPLLGK